MKISILKKATQTILILLFLTVLISPASVAFAENETGAPNTPSLFTFASNLKNGNAGQLTGVYLPNILAAPIVQQPAGQPGYVSTALENVTQFNLASKYGSIGLLAHNYLSGQYFNMINEGSIITLVYGDGHTADYQVKIIKQYQALAPNYLYSKFINLENPDKTLSSTDLFYETYGLGNVLVLQTCIEVNNEESWGRLFVIAEPYTRPPEKLVKAFNFPDLLGTRITN
jgi:hypothetical protein